MNFNHTFSQMKREAKILLSGHWGPMIIGLLIYAFAPGIIQGIFQVILLPQDTVPSASALTIFTVVTIIISLLIVVLNAGYIKMSLMICRRQDPGVGDLFYTVSHRPDKYIFSTILVGIVTALPIIPGMIMMGAGIINLGLNFMDLYINANSYDIYNYEMNIPDEVLVQSGTILLGACLLLIAGCIVSIIVGLMYEMVFPILLDNEDMGVIDSMRASRRLMKGHKGRFFLLQLSFLGWIILGIFTLGILYLWLVPYIQTTTMLYYFDLKREPVPDSTPAPGQMPGQDDFTNQHPGEGF